MEEQNIKEQTGKTAKKPTASLGGMLGVFGAFGEKGLTSAVFNLPVVLFLVVMAMLHIGNNHMAVNYARRIANTEKEVKQLRWHHMTSAAALVKKSKQSE